MLKILFAFVLVFFSHFCASQLRNVRLVNHAGYLISVVQATVSVLEERGWCNLKIPDIEQNINETIYDRESLGTVTYKNGFVVSIQHVDIQQSTVQQVWSRTNQGQVDVQGRFRMHNVVIGFDVLANINAEEYRYTGTFTHPLVNFEFSIVRDLNVYTTNASVRAVIPNPPNANMVNFAPRDNITDVLNAMYVRTSTIPGMVAWGPDVFTPIVNDIVNNKIEFATVCYNCVVTP
ncbi:uncharacterized protein LOC115449699 [Manduca sexta]|uniref:Uncharacterized protein n=1 Tax=Manduca sexta TaxID=7130 RepID=A0A921YM68_MANSE|nr:uncharacterized protein LOC115449699 [Manduca sexta]KAG6441946.1 hypothetical protein O3G_MSEX002127 [Manduca sexta]